MTVLPYEIEGFEIGQIFTNNEEICVHARSLCQSASCPECGHLSTTLHGWYQRHPQEISSVGRSVHLCLEVKRFRCEDATCPRQTFAESLCEWLPTYARRTRQLTAVMRQISMDVGAEVAQRLLRYLRIQISGDTLLRILRHFGQDLPPMGEARVIGVDDWAFKRGKTYGTIIVNLETHQVIDLLPDRTADTLANWLREHATIEIVSRDRSTDYKAGICSGAPHALQVADRWHLLLNVRQMLERYLAASVPMLKKLPISEAYQSYLDQQRPAFIRTRGETRLSNQKREERLLLYETIQQMRHDGWNISQLTRELQCHPDTIRKYFYATTFPERSVHRHRKSNLDPYITYLDRRLQEGCENGQQLWREIQQQGYPGSSKQVMKWLQPRRSHVAPTTPLAKREPPLSTPAKSNLPSTKYMAWTLVRDPDTLSDTDRLLLDHLRQDSQLDAVYVYIHRFIVMVKQRLPQLFDDWLEDARTVQVSQLQNFVVGLRQDYDAIHAALSLPWSNGQTEGQVNRLKFIKRQMYGRAKFDLLRLRVLAPT
jgi:transposase